MKDWTQEVLQRGRKAGRLRGMRSGLSGSHCRFIRVLAVCAWVGIAPAGWAEVPQKALAEFQSYAGKVEARLAQQHRSAAGFVAEVEPGAMTRQQLSSGELVIEKLTPGKGEVPGGLLHDWRGTAFVKGATAKDFERLMKNFGAYAQMYSPQVVRAEIVSPKGASAPDHFTATMRVKQKHVITVVMDTTYGVTYGRLDARHGYSTSRSTKITEIEDAGTAKEHALPPEKEHGFLWRLNTYWSYEERDGGLYIQVESISLTRGIPTGLGWVVGPFVESVPRESLEFTLRNTGKALQR